MLTFFSFSKRCARAGFLVPLFAGSFTIKPVLGQSPPPSAAQAADSAFRVVLLGTGSPNPRPNRFGPSILVEAGSERLVFDCGRSCTTRLWQLGIPVGTVKLFITHLHSDHTVGIPDLWLTGFLTSPYGRRTGPFFVWGPAGTAAMMTKLREAYDEDIRIRQPTQGVDIRATDFVEGKVYEQNGVRVTAFKVSHDDIDAYGFRIDYRGHSVVLSGDTRPSENLVAHARGVDVLVHEVGMGTAGAQSDLIATLHSTPEQAGEEFSRIRPKLAVYSHFSLFGTPEPTMDELVARTRKTYQGRLEIGEDLTAISVGDSVVVSRWSDETRNQLRAIERARLRSLVDADVATARRLHADDFELINPLGGTLSKEKYLSDIESGDLDYLEWEPGEIRVRLYDKSAVIRYKANLIVSVKGSAGRPVTFWHTDLYEKRNGEWQIVWSHATQVQQR